MKRRLSSLVPAIGIAASALFLFGCSTTESRISRHPEIYNSLSPRDQQLVTQGQIRTGMTQSAVWLSWGSPDRKALGSRKGKPYETWTYTNSAPAWGYGYGYGYPYGPYYGGYYGGFGGGFISSRYGHRYVFYGDPFYDPFYRPWDYEYPYKVATFVGDRLMSYQYLAPPYR